MKYLSLAIVFCLTAAVGNCQQPLWHNISRSVRYHPEGTDIVIENGNKRFNRALYGGNTAFRAEAGDLPEFALYLPGMGGNLKFGIVKNGQSKWLIAANNIKAIYRAGSMLYEIKDALLDNGIIYIKAIALFDKEGLMVEIKTANLPKGIQLVAAYGGATGKKFSRDGDIGADPESSFYLKPEYCTDNIFTIQQNAFQLHYALPQALSTEERVHIQLQTTSNDEKSKYLEKAKAIKGIFPSVANLKVCDANMQQSPKQLFESNQSSNAPLIAATIDLQSKESYCFLLQQPDKNNRLTYTDLPNLLSQAESTRKALTQTITLETPDPYINTLAENLSIAADAIWEDPSYMHGAVAWRMRLNGWRGPYIADVLGWHDRARKHFNGYALSQIISPLDGPVVADTALHLARQLEKLGNSVFSSGYISRNPGGDKRAHHYDMNLVFIDQLLRHFNWTGDTAYVKQMWPLIKRHLVWEKRNFDADNDGLYDAYAAIWASDALQYSGGGVTHSSAYNYFANKTAAILAAIIKEDKTPFEREASKILQAVNKQLWMKNNGWYAEYKDLLGNQRLHPSAGIWTIYHAIDEELSNPFQAYQSLQYINHHIPHIPIAAKGLQDTTLYTISTSNWQPYTWSLNNVALSEILHTSLAYWQGGSAEEAFVLWKSALMESMFLSSSPGSFIQLSFYDAIRGELYRDFADPIGMVGRSLVEGLFGIRPDLLHNNITVAPGFPEQWNHASLTTPDIHIGFKRNGLTEQYNIQQHFKQSLQLQLIVPVYRDGIAQITVNGKKVVGKMDAQKIGKPSIQITVPTADSVVINIKWSGRAIETIKPIQSFQINQPFQIAFDKASILQYFPNEQGFVQTLGVKNKVSGSFTSSGNKTLFVKVKQGNYTWNHLVNFNIIQKQQIQPKPIITSATVFDKINLAPYFNDEVNAIFTNQYLSPRPSVPTLQLPTQGIGNWAYPMVTANISDSGLRQKAGKINEIKVANNIPIATTGLPKTNNIVYTSLWDNYPDSVVVPLAGTAQHGYVLMAGSTNPMQSRVVNGVIDIHYMDGTITTVALKNPENWWPIEQDYYVDGFAFQTGAPKPIRISLKTGEEMKANYKYSSIKGFSGLAIDGGAATVLDFSIDNSKPLKNITLKTIANDVVIGLMGLTLIR
ncbi:MAG: DUF4450 domain-containing protein [Chitinophagaceae bacterium]|nr:DUF4450 domain-containing protein [Chitinophagaceae bacterium]